MIAARNENKAVSKKVDARWGKVKEGADQREKLEIRNPKFETNSNDQKTRNSKQISFEFGVLEFPDFRFVWRRVCFGFRISCFGFRIF